jgi:hypothetical protein
MGQFWDIVGPLTGGMPPPAPIDVALRRQQHRPPTLDADGRVAGDFPCHHCGYNLRALLANEKCPECGTDIRASIGGNVLKFSDPAWLRRVATGARWMGKAGVLGLVFAIVWDWTEPSTISDIATLIVVPAVMVFLVGAWMATTPDPSGIDEQRCARLSMAARSLLAAGLLAAPISALRGYFPMENLIRSLTALLLAVGFAGVLTTVRYFQRLTLRIPDGRLFAALEGHFRFLFTVITAATLAVWIMNCFTQPPPFSVLLACVLVSPLIIAIFASLRFLSLCSELAWHLNEQAKTAEKLWPAAGAGTESTA